MKDQFPLNDTDHYAVSIAIECARRSLARPDIPAWKAICIGKALFALERLPEPPLGVWVSFGVSLRQGKPGASDLRFLEFLVTEDSFEISRGGSAYDAAVGSDSYSLPGYRVEFGGFRETEVDLSVLEDEFRELLNLGAAIEVGG